VPDWLRDLQGELASSAEPAAAEPPAPEDAPPDWLREMTAEPPPPAPEPARPAFPGATSWLRSLAEDTPPAEQPAAEQPPEPPTTTSRVRLPVGATDWLRSIGQETEPSESAFPAEPPEAEPAADDSGIPDWLRDVTPEELEQTVAADTSGPAAAPPAAGAAPSWLADRAATEQPAEEDSISSAVPDWLADLTPVDVDAGGAPPRAEAAVPDWLADLTPVDVDAGGAPPRAEAAVPAWLAGDDDDAQSDEFAPDWLRDRTREAEEAAVGAPEALASDEEVPAWLRDAEGAREAPVVGGEEVPAWLRDAEGAREAPVVGGEDVPAWLRDAEGAREASVGGGEEVPAWLRDAEGAREAPVAGDEDVPAWLRDAEGAREAPVVGDEDVPAWLRDAEGAREAPVVGGEAVPAWLREIAEPSAEPPAEGGATPLSLEPDDESPTWLREAMREEAERESRRAEAASGDLPAWLVAEDGDAALTRLASESPAEMNLPSWLRGAADEPPPAPPPARPARPNGEPFRRSTAPDDAEGIDFLSGAVLPPWLQNPEQERPTETEAAQTLDWYQRLASQDTETEDAEAPVAAVPPAHMPHRRTYQRTSDQLEAIELLGRLVQAPYPTPAAPAAPQPRTRWQRIGIDRVLYVVLILALLAGLIAPSLTALFQTATPEAPGAAALHEVIGGLDSEQVVLVAYEWAAQRSSELRPLEDAVTERLIAQRAKLIIVSTDLQGTLISFDRIEPLRQAGYNEAGGGTDYVLLGYRPGGELALRSLARDLRAELARDFNGNDATVSLVATNLDGSPRVGSIRDLGLIVVMADQPQDVQAWMEQVHRVAPNVPIAFVLPQETQPLVQPYLRLPNVYHLAGRQGALALQVGASAPAQIAQATGQQNLAIVVFIALLIGGAASVAVGRARRPRES
jgi:hypothetical protein